MRWIPLALLLAACAGPGDGPQRPNVVVLVADDHRADALSATGHPFVRTPALDRLAAGGARFAEAFSTHGVCAPARAALLTGKSAAGHGVSCILSGGGWHTFRRQETPFPALLATAAGYDAIHIGKWHLGANHLPRAGYARWIGTERLRYFGTRWWVDGAPAEGPAFEGHCDLTMARLAAAEIDRRAEDAAPFALFVAFKSPHEPFTAAPAHADDFAGVTIPRPPSYGQRRGLGAPGPAIDGPRGLGLFDDAGDATGDGRWQAFIKAYYRSVHTLDDAVGIVLEALERNRLRDDTLVVYTSDQGLALGERGVTGKIFGHEQTLRVPLLVRYPREIAPGTRREMALITDIAPTVLDFAGVPVPDGMSGRSLRPLLAPAADAVEPWREDFLFEYWYHRDRGRRPAHLVLRTGRYKLVRFVADGRQELYDLEADPGELEDRAADPAYAEVLADLERRLERRVAASGWRPRVQRPVHALLGLAPLPDQAAAVTLAGRLGNRLPDPDRPLEVAGRALRWQRLEAGADGRFDLGALARDGGSGALLVAAVALAERRDPAVLVRFTSASGPLTVIAGASPGPRWQFRPGARRRTWSDQVFNPPLDPGVNALWLALDRERAAATLELAVVAPRGAVDPRPPWR